LLINKDEKAYDTALASTGVFMARALDRCRNVSRSIFFVVILEAGCMEKIKNEFNSRVDLICDRLRS
jgi:hypothetical protein